MSIVCDDAVFLKLGGPKLTTQDGKYLIIFPKSVQVPDFIVYEEIYHLK